MAKGKKSNESKQSKGIVGRSAKTRTKSPAQKILNKQKAWLKGQKVFVTIPNPNEKETNRKFIRVEARTVWGLPPFLRNKERNENKGTE